MTDSLKEQIAIDLANTHGHYVDFVVSIDDLESTQKQMWLRDAEGMIKRFRLVQLDEDQTLPSIPSPPQDNYGIGYSTAQQDMLKASFRKVKEQND